MLLIDLDLRRHALSSQLGHSNSKTGITSYLAGTVSDVESMIQNSGFHQNLDVIYAGVQPPNPAEMLLSDKLDKLIAEMRGRYDYVFLDSTPAMSVADAIITDRLADLCIYIVREGVLDRRQLPDIERLYREEEAPQHVHRSKQHPRPPSRIWIRVWLSATVMDTDMATETITRK